MRNFKYFNAGTIEEASSILKKYRAKARIIAGGTDVLGEMKDDILPVYPDVLINIKNISGLDYIREEKDGLHLGPLTRLEDVANNPATRKKYPALAEAARRTASPHIREMGTIAGNICQNNRCWYYWVADNRFDCLRKGGKTCYALTGDARYHSIFGAKRIKMTPCSSVCPDNIDIPAYMNKIREGDFKSATGILLKSNPIPAITGRICPHFCESECNRSEYDEAVSIRNAEKVLGDYALDNSSTVYPVVQPSTNKRIAVIGSGPAGLSAAYYLQHSGHEVEIFEKMPLAGGMLNYGIPPFRLSKDIVDKQIGALEATGIKFNLNFEIDKSGFKELVGKYDAVFIACGAWKERLAGIPGEEYLLSGTEYLKRGNLGDKKVPGKKVGIIGAGNVSIDVARTLKRLGAEPLIIYRRTRAEMPALQEEIEKAEEEGIKFEFLTLPVEAFKKNGRLALKCVRMKLGPPDESGRPRPVPIHGSDTVIQFDAVFKAIGEQADRSFLPAEFVDKSGELKVAEKDNSLAKGIFVGGDFAAGPSTVVAAIASGRKGADYIDQYLTGKISKQEKDCAVCSSAQRFNTDFLKKTVRVSAIETEASRCFNCGCLAVNPSDLAPALIALKSKIVTNKRSLEAEKLFEAGVDKTTVLKDGEIVLEIVVPKPSANARSRFIKMAIRKSIDFPVVNCAASLESKNGVVTSARICLNSVFNEPVRVTEAERFITGKKVDESIAAGAAEAGLAAALPLLNNKYKIEIAKTLVKRVILACVAS